MLFTTTLRIVRDCVFTYIELHCYYIVKRGCLERRPVLLRKKAQSYCDGDTQVYSVTFFCYRRLSPPVHFLGQILLYYSSTQLKIGCNKGNSKKRPPRSSRPLYIGFFLRKARSCRQALQLFFSKIVSSLGTSRPIGTKVKHSCGTKRDYFNTFNTKKDAKYDPKFIRNVNEAERIQKYLQLHVSKFLMLFTTTLRIVQDCVFTYIKLH